MRTVGLAAHGYNRARILSLQGDLRGAIAEYSKAIDTKPDIAVLYQERGYAYLRAHDPRHAVTDEDAAIRIEPSLAMGYLLRAMAHGELGDSAGATQDAETAVRLDGRLAQFVKVNGPDVAVFTPPRPSCSCCPRTIPPWLPDAASPATHRTAAPQRHCACCRPSAPRAQKEAEAA